MPNGALSLLVVLLRNTINDFRLRHHCSAGNQYWRQDLTIAVLAIFGDNYFRLGSSQPFSKGRRCTTKVHNLHTAGNENKRLPDPTPGQKPLVLLRTVFNLGDVVNNAVWGSLVLAVELPINISAFGLIPNTCTLSENRWMRLYQPFKYDAQTALFKDPVRTAQ